MGLRLANGCFGVGFEQRRFESRQRLQQAGKFG
jgi:hypothetical protein